MPLFNQLAVWFEKSSVDATEVFYPSLALGRQVINYCLVIYLLDILEKDIRVFWEWGGLAY